MIKGQFAKNLHKAVSERSIKQVDLAKAVNVPPTTVSGWFRGAHLPDLDKLMDICEYLDMPVGKLVGDKRYVDVSKALDIDVKRALIKVGAQEEYIKSLESKVFDLNTTNEELMRQLECDEELGEVLATDGIHDNLKYLKDAGVSEITIKF